MSVLAHHAVRFIPLGHRFGGACACGWYGERWRANRGWVRRDWHTHLSADPSVPTDTSGRTQDRLDAMLKRGILTSLEYTLYSYEVFSAATVIADAAANRKGA